MQVRDIAAIYDSYNCGIIWKFGHCRPWPSKRQGFRSPASPNCSSNLLDKLSFPRYVGYGPTKNYAVRALRRKRCPVKCRPEAHKDWEYCWTYPTNPRLALEKTGPFIGRLRHLQSEGGTNGLEKFNSTEDLFHGPSFFSGTKWSASRIQNLAGEAKARGRRIEVDSNVF